MTIYLIRHGKTCANEEHLYCGSTDLPLSQAGIEELCKLNYRIPCTRYLTSGKKRTEETLELLFGKVPHQVEPAFREVDFGEFEMYSYEQLRHRSDYQAWLTGDNERNVPPGGESGEQMRRRVIAAFSLLREDTVVITHGGVIASIMEYCFPKEHKNRYQWQPAPGHGYAISGQTYWSLPKCTAP